MRIAAKLVLNDDRIRAVVVKVTVKSWNYLETSKNEEGCIGKFKGSSQTKTLKNFKSDRFYKI